MKIKISKSQWEEMGRIAGWNVATARKNIRRLQEMKRDINQVIAWRFKQDLLETYPDLQKAEQKLLDAITIASQVENSIEARQTAVFEDRHRKYLEKMEKRQEVK